MANFTNDFTPKKPLIFVCEICDFKSSNKKDFNRHILTDKHKMMVEENFVKPQKPQISLIKNNIY